MDVQKPNVRFDEPNEKAFGFWMVRISSVRFIYSERPKTEWSSLVKKAEMPKTERCKVNQPNVRMPNCLATELFSKTPKSERSDFGRLLYCSIFNVKHFGLTRFIM